MPLNDRPLQVPLPHCQNTSAKFNKDKFKVKVFKNSRDITKFNKCLKKTDRRKEKQKNRCEFRLNGCVVEETVHQQPLFDCTYAMLTPLLKRRLTGISESGALGSKRICLGNAPVINSTLYSISIAHPSSASHGTAA